ncbi:MAG: aldo/keto reductase [Oscillospiraceae bacterium]|nr:aldo/keto reductase [Oscillospiraceae bacterium]
MLYRNDRRGNPISQLGYGCMRFSRKGAGIDYDKAQKEILLAIEKGINYFDTAYIYPGSEELLGKVLESNHCRERVSIATKLPQYIIRSAGAVEKTFREELSRLRTDYIDYYLMHMFTDFSEWENLKAFGIEDWIAQKKASGAIRQIGFSYHGDTDMFLRLLDAYDWDFCQIQYNYLDENSQAGRKGLEAAAQRGIPVIIMEPLRGGKLVNLPDKAKKLLADDRKGWSPAELGLRWLWNQPGVTCVLSGMNSTAMIEENTRIASDATPGHFSEADIALTQRICSIIREREKVGCTGCRYCQPCPAGVDIPAIFHRYNLMYIEKKTSGRFGYAQAAAMKKAAGFATRCIGCGKCEKHCPQHIDIRDKLKEADKALRPLPYRIGIAAARKFLLH